VTRIDPAKNRPVRTIQVGSAPAGAAATGDGLWVTTRGTPTSHRGGTLKVIVGADACVRRPATCQLTKGIVTDASANTVTFRLTRPNPDFLADLAGPGAFVVPAATPAKDVGTSPAPATGPYMIQRFVPKRTVVLVPNPQFREWSRAAQPGGYPDRIEWNLSGKDQNSAVDAVLSGQADYYGLWNQPPAIWASDSPPGTPARRTSTRSRASSPCT